MRPTVLDTPPTSFIDATETPERRSNFSHLHTDELEARILPLEPEPPSLDDPHLRCAGPANTEPQFERPRYNGPQY